MLARLLLIATTAAATSSLCEQFCYTPISEGIFCTHVCASHVFKQHVEAQEQLQEIISSTRVELRNARKIKTIGAATVAACDSTALESCIDSLDFTTMLLNDAQAKTAHAARACEEFKDTAKQVIRTYEYIVYASLATVLALSTMAVHQD